MYGRGNYGRTYSSSIATVTSYRESDNTDDSDGYDLAETGIPNINNSTASNNSNLVENQYSIGPAMVTEEQYQCLKAAVAYNEKELAKLTQEMYDWLENVVGIKYNKDSGEKGGSSMINIPLFVANTEIRDPAITIFLIEQFNVASNDRYLKKNGKTYCNIFGWDVTSAMGAEIPHWVFVDERDNPTGEVYEFTIDKDGDYIYPPDTGLSLSELNANDTYVFLLEHGDEIGYREVTKEEAQIAANQGKVAVIIRNSGSSQSGHVAIIRPNGEDYVEEGDDPDAMYIAQAGTNNYNYGSAFKPEGPFGENEVAIDNDGNEYPVRYFVHD